MLFWLQMFVGCSVYVFFSLGSISHTRCTARGRGRRWLRLQLCKHRRRRRDIVHTTHSACDATNSRRRSLQRTAMRAQLWEARGRPGGGPWEAMWRTGPLSITGRRVPAPDGLQLVTVWSLIHGARWFWPRGNLFPGLSVLTWSSQRGATATGIFQIKFLF